ncbi:MAG: class I SAM-dependent methyltransferase [Syntrophales bacterium LBB04]|nr:class I SAM-dependent methyltransferase [Syntrophales bacterium LBB04]
MLTQEWRLKKMLNSISICPWWLGLILDNPIRRFIHNPEKILGGYIKSGQTVLDLGCGSGTFTISIARMVGETGKVIAVDVQEEMLQLVRKKAAKEGLESRIITLKSDANGLGVSDRVDFALAFYMVHEVPDVEAFLKGVASLLKREGRLLIVEPKLHVSAYSFKKTIMAAQQAGLKPIFEPKIWFSRSMLLQFT